MVKLIKYLSLFRLIQIKRICINSSSLYANLQDFSKCSSSLFSSRTFNCTGFSGFSTIRGTCLGQSSGIQNLANSLNSGFLISNYSNFTVSLVSGYNLLSSSSSSNTSVFPGFIISFSVTNNTKFVGVVGSGSANSHIIPKIEVNDVYLGSLQSIPLQCFPYVSNQKCAFMIKTIVQRPVHASSLTLMSNSGSYNITGQLSGVSTMNKTTNFIIYDPIINLTASIPNFYCILNLACNITVTANISSVLANNLATVEWYIPSVYNSTSTSQSAIITFHETGLYTLEIYAYNPISEDRCNLTIKVANILTGLYFSVVYMNDSNQSLSTATQIADFLFNLTSGHGYFCRIDFGGK
jgi:hypothetical protein